MRIYVEVSFAQPIGEGTLTYHLSANTQTPKLGTRVVVPVRNRRLIGYITGSHNTEPEFKTAPVLQVLDPLPLISQPMFKLAQIVANDCLASIGEMLHAMLPGGIRQKILRLIKLGPGASDGIEHPALLWLKNEGQINYSNFIKLFPAASSQMSSWLEQEIVEVSHSISKAAGPRIIKVLRICQNKPLEPDKLTPKERQVVEALLKLTSSPTAAALCRAAQTSSAPINQLKRKGLIEEVEERLMRQVATSDYYQREPEIIPELSHDQQRVLKEINDSYHSDLRPVLVRGVTCSGKTEVYLRWVAEMIAANKTSIVLVPEISLTPQMMKRFKDRFGSSVAILHSRLSHGERFDQWEKIRQGQCPVVVGARSAVFAPLPRLGTIILDEEGEPSFKQNDRPRYHAREVAMRRCQIEGGLLVMGSATPTIDSFYRCEIGDYRLVEMNQRVSDKKPPEVKVVDMRNELVTKKNRSIFSQELSQRINQTLKAKKQIILFLNRRGYSSFVFCRECGEPVSCSMCNVSLVYHNGSQIMRCHYCGEMKTVPKICPDCQSSAIKFFGAGTQRVESEAKRYFPHARIARLDSDTASTKGSMEEILDSFGQGKIDILIGTQMVAKGLDFPNVTLVGILAADSLLRVPDFRSSERNFSLLAQVSGRAGRGESPGKVVLQTYFPEHHSIQCALTEDYHRFYTEEVRLRNEAVFPPYTQLAFFIVSSTDKTRAETVIEQLSQRLMENSAIKEEMLLGPAPAALERLNGRFRFQLMLKFADLDLLTDIVTKALSRVKKTGDTRIAADINPCFML